MSELEKAYQELVEIMYKGDGKKAREKALEIKKLTEKHKKSVK